MKGATNLDDGPSHEEVKDTILKMGPDDVVVKQSPNDNTIYVSIFRSQGCGRIYRNVCGYLKKKYKKQDIVVMVNPSPQKWCRQAFKRSAGDEHFARFSLLALPDRIAIH